MYHNILLYRHQNVIFSITVIFTGKWFTIASWLIRTSLIKWK